MDLEKALDSAGEGSCSFLFPGFSSKLLFVFCFFFERCVFTEGDQKWLLLLS